MNSKSNVSTKDITLVGLMAALVFVGTYYFKIPLAFGYTHLGDCMIILAIGLFGTKKGALAGSIGAGLSDLLGGYFVWVLPTVFIKGIWALIAGTIAFKLLPNKKYNVLIGSIIGGLFHILLYTLVKIPLFGLEYALTGIPGISGQTIAGIVLGNILYLLMKKPLQRI